MSAIWEGDREIIEELQAQLDVASASMPEKSWRRLALQMMRYLNRDQITEAVKNSGAESFFCDPGVSGAVTESGDGTTRLNG